MGNVLINALLNVQESNVEIMDAEEHAEHALQDKPAIPMGNVFIHLKQ